MIKPGKAYGTLSIVESMSMLDTLDNLNAT